LSVVINVPVQYYVVNISQNGIKEFLVFEDVIEPADKQTLRQMAQTVKLISTKTL